MFKFIFMTAKGTISLLILLILLAFGKVSAQKTILLMSGNRIIPADLKVDSSGIILYKTFKGKVKSLEQDEVFSLTRADSVEVIFYKPGSEPEEFTVEEMRDYIIGMIDGKKKKVFFSFFGSFAVGFASGIFVPNYLAPIPVVGFSMGTGLIKVKDKNIIVPEKYNGNKHYIEGYKKGITKKRVTRSILGGSIGLITGIAVAAATK